MQILVRVRIIQRGRTRILQRFNYQREADLVTVIDNGHHVLRVVFAENKRLRVALRWKRESKCAGDLRIVRHDRGRGIPINVGAEYGNLSRCKLFKVLHLAALHIALRKYIYACGRVVDFNIARRLHHLVKLMPAGFHAYAAHLKGNDNIPLLNESVVQLAAVHALIARGADRAGGRIQSFHPRCHILICRGGHVNTVTVGIFEDKRKEHTISTPKYEFDKNQEK